jgi:hypothetical protein
MRLSALTLAPTPSAANPSSDIATVITRVWRGTAAADLGTGTLLVELELGDLCRTKVRSRELEDPRRIVRRLWRARHSPRSYDEDPRDRRR